MVKNNRKGSARNSKLKKNLQNKIKLSRFDIIHVWNSETFKMDQDGMFLLEN